jgi:hypothetical protein
MLRLPPFASSAAQLQGARCGTRNCPGGDCESTLNIDPARAKSIKHLDADRRPDPTQIHTGGAMGGLGSDLRQAAQGNDSDVAAFAGAAWPAQARTRPIEHWCSASAQPRLIGCWSRPRLPRPAVTAKRNHDWLVSFTVRFLHRTAATDTYRRTPIDRPCSHAMHANSVGSEGG